ncbi:MAG: hypothetical protein CR994_01970 [Maribacter sp.]|nr:MAG: hypothetical protein CR994_01970 [Maribacter sp.]
MKKIFFILVLIVVGQSRTYDKRFGSVGVDSVAIKEVGGNVIAIKADAHFNNEDGLYLTCR